MKQMKLFSIGLLMSVVMGNLAHAYPDERVSAKQLPAGTILKLLKPLYAQPNTDRMYVGEQCSIAVVPSTYVRVLEGKDGEVLEFEMSDIVEKQEQESDGRVYQSFTARLFLKKYATFFGLSCYVYGYGGHTIESLRAKMKDTFQIILPPPQNILDGVRK